MPLISVIMPAYNAKQFIASSIESVLNQTFSDFELIIINDGSSDNTLEIAQQFAQKDRRINIVSQENQGETAARNTGLAHAKGEYIAFLDSDDLYKEIFLEKLLNRIQEKSSDIAYCGFIYTKQNNKEEGKPFAEGNMLECYAFHKQHICIICVMIKHMVIKNNNIKFTPKRIMGGDQEFLMKCGLFAEKVAAVPEFLSIYRDNPLSITNLDAKSLLADKIKSDIMARDNILTLIAENYQRDSKQQVIDYFIQLKKNILINFKKQLWTQLKKGEFQYVYNNLQAYGALENFETKRTFLKSCEVAILNSKNLALWKCIALPLRTLKNVELKLKGKTKIN